MDRVSIPSIGGSGGKKASPKSWRCFGMGCELFWDCTPSSQSRYLAIESLRTYSPERCRSRAEVPIPIAAAASCRVRFCAWIFWRILMRVGLIIELNIRIQRHGARHADWCRMIQEGLGRCSVPILVWRWMTRFDSFLPLLSTRAEIVRHLRF